MDKKIGYIERLRGKPIGHRRLFAFIFSFSVTAVIAFFWLISAFTKYGTPEKEMQTAAAENASIFATIKEQFSFVIESNPIMDNLKRIDFGLAPGTTTNTATTSTYTATTTTDEQATTSSNILVE